MNCQYRQFKPISFSVIDVVGKSEIQRHPGRFILMADSARNAVTIDLSTFSIFIFPHKPVRLQGVLQGSKLFSPYRLKDGDAYHY